jgi:hypothetical protein
MPKKALLLLVTVSLLGINGCSAFIKSSRLQPEMSNTGWVLLEKSVIPTYEYVYENVRVVMSCFQHCRDGFLLLGPPILPFIPWPNDCGNFYIQVQIESLKDTSMLDLSNIRIELPAGESYQANAVYLSKKVKESFPLACHSPYLFNSDQKQIQVEKLVISSEKKHLCISFDILYIGIEEFSLDLGAISISDRNVPLPPLKFRKQWESEYCPLIMLGHGKSGICIPL